MNLTPSSPQGSNGHLPQPLVLQKSQMKRFYFIPILILIFSASCITATAQESKVRALFVLKFVENVLWPNEKKALIIGVIGKEEVFDELQARLKAKNPNGITVKKITASEAATCDVVYIASSVNNAITGISSLNKEILIITEADLSRRGSGASRSLKTMAGSLS
jgi:hypothetical protein